MKRNLILLCSLFAATALISSCAQDAMEPEVDAAATVAETRAYGDKTPKVMMYIEVNDTNPLNTMLYRMNGEPFIDITTIFAANIRANGSEPALWLNDNVTQLLIPSPATSTTTGHYKYVQPIRQDGGKVLLTILGDHQGVGVANLTAANQAKFAKILTWAVEEYGLDGIDFDDEWSKYGENPNFPTSVPGSFNGLIAHLRDSLDAHFPNDHKLITAYHYNDSTNLSSAAVGDMDFAWTVGFGPYLYTSPSSPWTNAKWSAQMPNMNQTYNAITLNQIKTRSAQSKNDGMGAIAGYDMRVHTERDPLPALQKIGEGAFNGTVTRSGSAYTKAWTAGAGTLITYDDVQ